MLVTMVSFGKRMVGAGHPCLVIAELGTSHQGDIGKGRALIESATRSGADCIKFQIVRADEILHPRAGIVDLPTGKVALYEKFKSLERELAFYAELKTYTEAVGALFLCSPFGIRSARELKSLGVHALKIASPELNHLPLLLEAGSYGLPLFISSGVSTLGDIERALQVIGKRNTVLMHCVTSYPAPEEQYNVSVLSSLRSVLGVEVGLSDHSLDPVLVPALAVLEGACVVEKHFTLSRDAKGLDDPIALEPEGFGRMVQAIRFAETETRDVVRARLEKEYGADRVAAVSGTGVKEMAAAELRYYARTNRSLHAMREISPGERIGEADVAILRTEALLRPGLGPEFLGLVVGARAKRRIPDGEGIEWADLI
jgi:sialic acid synthase SpsE